MKTCFIKTPLGIAKICGDIDGISEITVGHCGDVNTIIPIELQSCARQLHEYFLEGRQVFDFAIRQKGTEFQQKVWRELSDIPFGKTISYLDLAKKLGDPKVVRAAASANGKNKLWIVVPCHRVIGSDGSLTGYAGELWRKKWLLDHEAPNCQLGLF